MPVPDGESTLLLIDGFVYLAKLQERVAEGDVRPCRAQLVAAVFRPREHIPADCDALGVSSLCQQLSEDGVDPLPIIWRPSRS